MRDIKDWKKLLSGGFAYMTAPFAIHPLDKERAYKAFFLALRQGATIDDIKIEAEQYLKKKGIKDSSLQEQIKRVEKFCKAIRLTKKKSKAWLITWEYAGKDSPPIEERIIDIRDLRVSSTKIAEFIESYYIAQKYTLADKVAFSSRRKDNPYRVEYIFHPSGGRWADKMTCGHNPFISARVVENLEIFEGASGEHEITWEEIKPKS